MPPILRFACLALFAVASCAGPARGQGPGPGAATKAEPSRLTWDALGLAAGLLLVFATGAVYVAARRSADDDENQRDR